jgi:hypothetical protein
MDGVLYCKTHFEQLFKETGSFSKKFTPGNIRDATNLAKMFLLLTEKKLDFIFPLWATGNPGGKSSEKGELVSTTKPFS